MDNPIFMIDTFEGQGPLDLVALKENNVRYILCRLGAYSRLGGLAGNRVDDLFWQQWTELQKDTWFKKGVYIPYNPWRTWEYNLQWLKDNLPADCITVEIDIENTRAFYSSQDYAGAVENYIQGIKKDIPGVQIIVYTGQGSLNLLSKWPAYLPYSWAQYYYFLRPSDTLQLGWEELRRRMNLYAGPNNIKSCPGVVHMWQITGDKLVLPGSNKGLDVYVWMSGQYELDQLFPDSLPTQPNPIPTPVPSLQVTGPCIARILHDTEVEYANDIHVNYHSRAALPEFDHLPGNATGETNSLNGGKGTVTLSPKWMSFIESINTPQGFKYLFTNDDAIWHNSGTKNQVRELTTGGQLVEVLRVDNGHAYIRSLATNQGVPKLIYSWLVHSITVTVRGDTFYNPAGNPRILVISNPGEELWIDTKALQFLSNTVEITTRSLHVRTGPGTSYPDAGPGLSMKDKVKVLGIVKDVDGNEWAKIGENQHICMRQQGEYLATWQPFPQS
jgi:hypothetical protein